MLSFKSKIEKTHHNQPNSAFKDDGQGPGDSLWGSDQEDQEELWFPILLILCVCVCGAHVEVRGCPVRVSYLLPPRGFWRTNSGHQAWQVPFPQSHLTSLCILGIAGNNMWSTGPRMPSMRSSHQPVAGSSFCSTWRDTVGSRETLQILISSIHWVHWCWQQWASRYNNKQCPLI